DDLKAPLAGGEGGSETGGAASHDKDVGFHRCCGSRYHWRRIISAQNPGPIAKRTPYVPDSGALFMRVSSRTRRTEAEERFPNRFRHSREVATASSGRPRVSLMAFNTFGPPGCMTQV